MNLIEKVCRKAAANKAAKMIWMKASAFLGACRTVFGKLPWRLQQPISNDLVGAWLGLAFALD